MKRKVTIWRYLSAWQKITAGVIVGLLSLVGFSGCHSVVSSPRVYGGLPNAYQDNREITDSTTVEEPTDSVQNPSAEVTNE